MNTALWVSRFAVALELFTVVRIVKNKNTNKQSNSLFLA